MGAIYGGLSVADGIGFAIGPVLAGYLFDLSGSYNAAFLITAVGLLIAVALTFFLRNKSSKAIGSQTSIALKKA